MIVFVTLAMEELRFISVRRSGLALFTQQPTLRQRRLACSFEQTVR